MKGEGRRARRAAGDCRLLEAENAELREQLAHARAIVQRTAGLSHLATLAASIAHEVRNPLVAIQTFFQLAPCRLDDREFMTSFLKLTEEEVGRVCALVDELLSLARVPAAESRAARDAGAAAFDLAGVMAAVSALLEPHARRLGVHLEQRASGPLPLRGDPDQLRQLLLNLILNALEATPRGGRVTVGADLAPASCRIEIRDSGPGIDPAVRPHIFVPFFTTKPGGTGLGLSIARDIAGQHGGRIEVADNHPHGACFVVELPLRAGVRNGCEARP